MVPLFISDSLVSSCSTGEKTKVDFVEGVNGDGRRWAVSPAYIFWCLG